MKHISEKGMITINPILKQQASIEGLKGLNASMKLYDINRKEEKERLNK